LELSHRQPAEPHRRQLSHDQSRASLDRTTLNQWFGNQQLGNQQFSDRFALGKSFTIY
jgi:hypothetical protein